MTWANAFRYTGQILAVIAAAAILLRILRVRDPVMRVRVLQASLLLCLLLPFAQPRTPVLTLPVQRVDAVLDGTPAPVTGLPGPAMFWVTGCLLMLGRIALGLAGLRRLRRESIPFEPGVRISTRIASPAAFGFFNPVVLLPESARSLPEALRVPMIEHEREHIRRNDWVQALFEEICRAVLWFHPAVWWALASIRTGREHAVDAAVASHTGTGVYQESLIEAASWCASANANPHLASSMFRGHSLEKRLLSLDRLKENNMTKLHRAGAIATLSAAAISVLAVSTSALPLRAATPPQEKKIKVNVDRLKVVKKVRPVYPAEAKKERVQGVVTFDIVVGKTGEVKDIELKSGHPLLVDTAKEGLRQWVYEPVLLNGNPIEVSTSVDISFTLSK